MLNVNRLHVPTKRDFQIGQKTKTHMYASYKRHVQLIKCRKVESKDWKKMGLPWWRSG